METGVLIGNGWTVKDGSYRTYEEWKRNRMNQICKGIVSRSYRTYEEWKPNITIHTIFEIRSSYRTYEEWKQSKLIVLNTKRIKVLTVPMRNGNVLRTK